MARFRREGSLLLYIRTMRHIKVRSVCEGGWCLDRELRPPERGFPIIIYTYNAAC